jgi:hypothetical protein
VISVTVVVEVEVVGMAVAVAVAVAVVRAVPLSAIRTVLPITLIALSTVIAAVKQVTQQPPIAFVVIRATFITRRRIAFVTVMVEAKTIPPVRTVFEMPIDVSQGVSMQTHLVAIAFGDGFAGCSFTISGFRLATRSGMFRDNLIRSEFHLLTDVWQVADANHAGRLFLSAGESCRTNDDDRERKSG